jgi:hypothetical protein
MTDRYGMEPLLSRREEEIYVRSDVEKDGRECGSGGIEGYCHLRKRCLLLAKIFKHRPER